MSSVIYSFPPAGTAGPVTALLRPAVNCKPMLAAMAETADALVGAPEPVRDAVTGAISSVQTDRLMRVVPEGAPDGTEVLTGYPSDWLLRLFGAAAAEDWERLRAEAERGPVTVALRPMPISEEGGA